MEDDILRQHEVKQLIYWIASIVKDPNDLIVVGGDFNADKGSGAYNLFEQFGFLSAYKETHAGKEPDFTFPTGLQAPFMDTDPAGTFDFIFYKG